MDIMQSCNTLGKEDVQVGEDKGEWEEVAEDVVGDLKVSGANDEVERAIILSKGTLAALLVLEFEPFNSCNLSYLYLPPVAMSISSTEPDRDSFSGLVRYGKGSFGLDIYTCDAAPSRM